MPWRMLLMHLICKTNCSAAKINRPCKPWWSKFYGQRDGFNKGKLIIAEHFLPNQWVSSSTITPYQPLSRLTVSIPSALHAFLYCSVFDPTQSAECVGDIVRTSREKNQHLGLTGILIFDGSRFCQYLEGPAQELNDVLTSIKKDQRHKDVKLQLHGPMHGERKFKGWSIAYAEVDEEISLAQMSTANGNDALLYLNDLLPSLDLC